MSGNPLPEHVAIIMDGNGRWAKAHNLPRFRGHLEGVKRVEEVAHCANDMGIRYLTLFTFSTENWRRPASEVSMLMRTVSTILQTRVDSLMKVNIRVGFIGRRAGLPGEVLQSIDRAIEITRKNTGLVLVLAFNYGSRTEILGAVRNIAHAAREGELDPETLDESSFGQFLYTAGMPDPSLLIRTSGEKRISNFLLWQLSYAELYFTDKCWPEFNAREFKKAIADYQKRDRRFGKVPGPKTPVSV